MSWLHSGERGSFQMQRLCEDDLSSDTKAAGLGGFLLKFHSIRTLVTTGAQNHFKYMPIGPIVPEFVPSLKKSQKQFKGNCLENNSLCPRWVTLKPTLTFTFPFRSPL